jgi:3-deoxy-D-arabino-heptulosonate 7-phosphate (DAHP) synthase
MLTITEAMAPADIPLMCAHANILQVGSRNMHNYSLLRAVGESGHPVLLERGMCSTLEELLLAVVSRAMVSAPGEGDCDDSRRLGPPGPTG